MKVPVAVLLVLAVLAVLAALAGCGAPPDDRVTGTGDTASLDGSTGALELAAESSKPVIDSVTTDDGFTQIRQNGTASLVIRGKKLQHTESVTVGELFVSLDSVSAHEVRVTVDTFGFGSTPPGPLDVSVTSKHGTTVRAGAIELTPFVVSPTAAVEAGHGTFQSPMNLCDFELQNAGFFSRVILLAGTHRCGTLLFMEAGVTVEGDPAGGTIVTGANGSGFSVTFATGPADAVSTVRDVTFASPLEFASISTGVGGLLVERVVDHGGGISASGEGLVRIDHYTYEGDGIAIELAFAEITNTTIRHCGLNPGIRMSPDAFHSFAFGTIDHVVVEDCETGIAVGLPGSRRNTNITIGNSELIDNRTGILVSSGDVNISNVVIRDDEATPLTTSTGISIRSGTAFVTDVEITGCDDVGIALVQTSSNGFDAGLHANRLTINGGQVGIAFQGIDNHLSMQNSIVRDQTAAALYASSIDSSIHLGSPGFPGNNALSVLSGFVIDDDRQFNSSFFALIQAHGTTLNGVRFDGELVEGPAELAPFYRFRFNDSGIQF
jgi:predicted small lipoprotein YifL